MNLHPPGVGGEKEAVEGIVSCAGRRAGSIPKTGNARRPETPDDRKRPKTGNGRSPTDGVEKLQPRLTVAIPGRRRLRQLGKSNLAPL